MNIDSLKIDRIPQYELDFISIFNEIDLIKLEKSTVYCLGGKGVIYMLGKTRGVHIQHEFVNILKDEFRSDKNKKNT